MAYKNQHSTYVGTLHFICAYLKIKSLPKDRSAYVGKGYVQMQSTLKMTRLKKQKSDKKEFTNALPYILNLHFFSVNW